MTGVQSSLVTSSAPDDLEDTIKELEQAVQVGLERLGHYRVVHFSEDIPLDVKDRPLHPSNISDSDCAIIYRYFFDVGGYAGLERAVQARAAAHQQDDNISPKANYAIMNDDGALPFMMILASMYPGFLKALIDGDIFYQYSQDPELRKAFHQTHSLEKHPGNYIQGLVLEDSFFDVSTTPTSEVTEMTLKANRKDNPNRGMGLNFSQLHDVYVCAERYIPGTPKLDLKMVEDIDAMFPPLSKSVNYKTGQHKYVQEDGNKQKVQAWLKALKENFIDRIMDIMQKDPKDPILHEPMRVSLLEIGWGQDAKARASNHDDHVQSNALFTFFQALIKYLFGNMPSQTTFNVQRLATNFLNRGDNIDDAFLDAKLADVGITMIGRTEWFHGGLNPMPGGGGGVKRESLKRMLPWIIEHAQKTYTGDQSRFRRNILEDKTKIAALAALDALTEQEIDDGETECEDLERQCQIEWNTIKNEMKLLEKVKLVHITQKLTQAAQSDPFRIRQDDLVRDVSPRFGLDGAQEQGVEPDEETTAEGIEDDMQENLEGLAAMRIWNSADDL